MNQDLYKTSILKDLKNLEKLKNDVEKKIVRTNRNKIENTLDL